VCKNKKNWVIETGTMKHDPPDQTVVCLSYCSE